MIMGLLDITLSRPEQENDALLWANCIHLLWHWWFLDVFFLSKLFFLLHYPAFLSEHLFRLPTSFVERWLALLASASQKWKVGWARHASSFWEEDLLFKGTMRCFCFYAVTNAAIDVRISCGISHRPFRLSHHGKWNSQPLINLLENSLGFTSAIWNENCWFWHWL